MVNSISYIVLFILGGRTWCPTGWRVAPLLASRFVHLQQVGVAGRGIVSLPKAALEIHTPLRVEQWAARLQNHPNRLWVECLLSGLRDGVPIGFNPLFSCQSAKSNMHSAFEHQEVVQSYLDNELVCGNVAGPFQPESLNGVFINRFGVIPKNNKPGKWRLIVDLSHPDGCSVNDGISSADSSMIYSSIDDAARLILASGKGALLAKIDIASAFRIIPVHPSDCHLLGMLWKGVVFIDKQLPFGLRSAPLIFNAYADALEWILRDLGVA